MRRTFRLLASVKPARYLEAGAPTGLTGLYTHPSPRSALLFLYSSTLDKLRAVPEHSVYRQSVEALTKHRMALVEATVPPGHEEWASRARTVLAAELEHARKRSALTAELDKAEKELAANAATTNEHDKNKALRVAAMRKMLAELPPVEGDVVLSVSNNNDVAVRVERNGQNFFIRHLATPRDQRDREWDGAFEAKEQGLRTLKETQIMKESLEESLRKELVGEKLEAPPALPALGPEPQLTADQISELETKIGAGLIEEVIQVAEGELKLVDVMVQAKVWESLEEQPAEGQWKYFERRE
ncbi:ETC complex I subunit conserved region-domain-containing protein [Echria macrotheca]|uniref:ETC complex I subunit conserved region-domain-containing protein n=1 Tax=Echria macrotheca TaxID=438768 RepID=A0AAJ0FBV7_9PEZI|nr:ETC complex I subunit conserved region-domain-containing protein [Echria macrotheca]